MRNSFFYANSTKYFFWFSLFKAILPSITLIHYKFFIDSLGTLLGCSLIVGLDLICLILVLSLSK